jgi:hypothetical protein
MTRVARIFDRGIISLSAKQLSRFFCRIFLTFFPNVVNFNFFQVFIKYVKNKVAHVYLVKRGTKKSLGGHKWTAGSTLAMSVIHHGPPNLLGIESFKCVPAIFITKKPTKKKNEKTLVLKHMPNFTLFSHPC